MNGLVQAAIGALFGQPKAIDWEEKARQDRYDARRRMQEAAHNAGWRSWVPLYMNTLDPIGTPYDWGRVWIWRLEWDFPQEVDPNQLDPQMNVTGLLWKPWRPNDPQALDKPT